MLYTYPTIKVCSLNISSKYLAQSNNRKTDISSHSQTQTMFWTIGCLYGASSVVFGAFGAHGLKSRIADPSRLANWHTAANYQVQPNPT